MNKQKSERKCANACCTRHRRAHKSVYWRLEWKSQMLLALSLRILQTTKTRHNARSKLYTLHHRMFRFQLELSLLRPLDVTSIHYAHLTVEQTFRRLAVNVNIRLLTCRRHAAIRFPFNSMPFASDNTLNSFVWRTASCEVIQCGCSMRAKNFSCATSI